MGGRGAEHLRLRQKLDPASANVDVHSCRLPSARLIPSTRRGSLSVRERYARDLYQMGGKPSSAQGGGRSTRCRRRCCAGMPCSRQRSDDRPDELRCPLPRSRRRRQPAAPRGTPDQPRPVQDRDHLRKQTDQVQTIPRQGHQEAYAALLPVAGPRRAELATSKKSAGERWKTSACEWWAGGEGVRTIQYNFNCLPETIEHVPLSIPLSSSLLVMRSTASWWVAPDPP
jgi:hypothetical protein